PNGGKGVATGYPRYDEKLKTVVTLPMTLNMCREANGEKPLPYGKPEIVALETYLKSLSNGMPINVKVSGKEALAKYEAGKAYYNARRGQLNFSCATCHVQNAGKMIRADLLSPMMGQANHFPTYRGAWNRVGTMQDRYRGCNSQVRAKPEDFESENYRNLEYYHTYMSNGIPIEVPGYRK
ncbi:MAG: sulfur oxidation c-type cytochrome SoxA, partial [Pseudomonadota bacterium]